MLLRFCRCPDLQPQTRLRRLQWRWITCSQQLCTTLEGMLMRLRSCSNLQPHPQLHRLLCRWRRKFWKSCTLAVMLLGLHWEDRIHERSRRALRRLWLRRVVSSPVLSLRCIEADADHYKVPARTHSLQIQRIA